MHNLQSGDVMIKDGKNNPYGDECIDFSCVELIKEELKESSESIARSSDMNDIYSSDNLTEMRTFIDLSSVKKPSEIATSAFAIGSLPKGDSISCLQDNSNDEESSLFFSNTLTVQKDSTTYVPCQSHSLNTPPELNTSANSQKMPLHQDQDGDTILHILVAKKDDERTLQCIPKCTSGRKGIDAVNTMGQTALHLALYQEMLDVTKCLLKHSAQTCIFDCSGNIPIHIACEKNREEFVKALLRYTTDRKSREDMVNIKNSAGLAPIHIATIKGNTLILKILFKNGADVNIQECRSGKTSLVIALEKSNETIAKMFIHDFSADVNIPTFSGFFPLHYACVENNIEMVTRLLEAGSTVGNKTVELKSEKDLATTPELKNILESAYRRKRRKRHGSQPP